MWCGILIYNVFVCICSAVVVVVLAVVVIPVAVVIIVLVVVWFSWMVFLQHYKVAGVAAGVV